MGGGSYNYETIPDMVNSGKLSIDTVNEAVRRQLRAKFAIGLFEKPYSGVAVEEQAKYINTPEVIALARQLDAESIVLLENHDNILPLEKNTNIAVIGPMAHGRMNVCIYQHLSPLSG
jgi:beta-glucosidase